MSLPGLCLLAFASSSTTFGADAAGVAVGPKVPVALTWGSGGRLLVALREGRRIAVVDPASWRVAGGWDVPARPASLELLDDGETLLLGGMDGESIVLDRQGRVVGQLPSGKGPTRVLSLAGGRAAVASRWDASVRVVDWRAGRTLSEHRVPFPTGAMVRRPDGRVVVADAFGGRLADFVPGKPGSERVRTLDGVNLQAMGLSGDGKELLLAHMEPYDTVPITNSNIDWGLVLSSRLSAVRLSDFDAEDGGEGILPRRRLTLDGPSHGAADPSALAVTPDGTRVIIALAGAHQLIKNDRTVGSPAGGPPDLLPLGHNQRLEVVEVGRSPVALVLDPAGELAVTADSMSDTLSVVRLADLSRVATVALGDPSRMRTPAQRGEAAFLDGRRSLDRWMSCASCHASGHTNGLEFDTQGDGGFGAPKNTPSLLGVGGTAPFAWTGNFSRLADQVHQSLVSSLRGPRPDAGEVEDLAAYLESLPPPPPRRPADDPAARRGEVVFRALRCDSCHRPPLYTSPGLRDVGLDDGVGGHHRFNPPSLRGVAWSAPYLHDGRAATLGAVLDQHPRDPKGSLTHGERDDLIAFLESL